MASADLIVMGGGIFGLACAWTAAQRGAKVRVIEAKGIGAGSSGGVVGALSPHVPENWNPKKQFQLESLLMAEAFWNEVGQEAGLPTGYARLGRLQPLADDVAVARAQARAQEAEILWQGKAAWRVVPSGPDGWAPESGSGFLVEDTLSARLHPRLAAQALVTAIRAKGGFVLHGQTAPDDPTGAPVIWATGYSGLLDLNSDLGKKVGGGVKGQALLVKYAAQHMPQLFAAGLHIVPHEDGTVAIGSTSENEWADETSVDAAGDALFDRACDICPSLRGAEVIERWAGVRPRARSRAPMLGPWPGRSGHFVANGGFKIGFGMAPKVAEVICDLVLEGRDRVPEGFRVEDSL